jgi:hypothetical protein
MVGESFSTSYFLNNPFLSKIQSYLNLNVNFLLRSNEHRVKYVLTVTLGTRNQWPYHRGRLGQTAFIGNVLQRA